MATEYEYLLYILDMLSSLDGISYKAMMGEYILYYNGKIVGGIYDNRLLVKPIDAAINYMKNPVFEIPYPGGKEMLAVDNLDDREYLSGLFDAMYRYLPFPKVKKPKIKNEN